MINKINYRFDSNSKLILLFTILTFALITLYSGEVLTKNFLSTFTCLFLILTVGVSHGALDDIKGYKVLKFYKVKNKIVFYLSYISSALLVIFIWILFPTIALTLFLTIAAYHFGKEDSWSLTIKKSNLNSIKFFLKGSLIILAPLWLSFEETILIFNTLGVKNQEFYNFLGFLSFNKLFLLLVLLSILSNILISRELKHLTGFAWEIICILALYEAFNPLVAFTIYFCFSHSLKHMVSLKHEFNINIQKFIKKAFPLTLLTSILFFFGIYILTRFQNVPVDSSIINVIFIGLASLTFPHILLEYLLEKNEKKS
jgi:Brp/Blh family beta-carotene 15,15'-monooxygenase|tara:strand:- start:935 stop:1876 length:942 start_codon:yes stop_codon:yes gene_type:complete